MEPADLNGALLRLGLSQAEAARLMGVDKQTVWRWLHGERDIPPLVPRLLLLVETMGLKKATKLLK